jgi:DNA-binding beta-propeller fold protein YncE
MALKTRGVIEIPNARGTSFDHGAFDPKSRRVFVAHTARDRLDVIDHDASRHIATLEGFAEAAGVVALDGNVLVTNRGAASLAWVDAFTLETRVVMQTALRPNGVAITSSPLLAIVACIGNETSEPELQVIDLDGSDRWSLKLPGRPRWCVTDASNARVFLAIREPTMVLVASLPDLRDVQHWPLPSGGAHGMDIDHRRNLLYVACDDGALVEVDTASGQVQRQWPLVGGPDATFFNPVSGRVHVAIADPGLVQTIDPRTGAADRFDTARGAKTTALVVPDRLYVLSPSHAGILELMGA